jgi:type I restriction enzyme, S subunit
MPNWQQQTTADLIRQSALFIGDGYRAKNAELGSNGLPFLRAGNINEGFDFNVPDHFPEDQLHKVGNKISQPGDSVLTTKGTVGRFAFVREKTPRFVYSPQLSFWRVLNRDIIDPRFLYFWLLGPEFQTQCSVVKGQTDMADYVSLNDQRRMLITSPPLPSQLRIADILGALDDKIEANRRINRTLEAMAQVLFKHWFVDFGPFQDGPFVESELGLVPEGWTIRSLDQIAHFLNGLALQKYPPEDPGDSLPVIKIAEMRRGVTESSGRASPNIDRKYIVEDGDVLFSWSGSLDVCLWFGGRGALNQHLFKVTSTHYPKWLFYQWVRHYLPEFRKIAADKATTMGHIQRYHLSDAKVLVPANDTLKVVDDRMAPLLDQFIQKQIESNKLAAIRDYLLPRLLSGEIAVEAAEEALVDAR